MCWHGPTQHGGSASPGPGAVDSSGPAPFVSGGRRGGLAGRVRQGGGAGGVGRETLGSGAHRRGPVGSACSGRTLLGRGLGSPSTGVLESVDRHLRFLEGCPAPCGLRRVSSEPQAAGVRADGAWRCPRADVCRHRTESVVLWDRRRPHERSPERCPRPAAAERPGTHRPEIPRRVCPSVVRDRDHAPRAPSARLCPTPLPTLRLAGCPTNHPQRGVGGAANTASTHPRRQHRVGGAAGSRPDQSLAQSSRPTALPTVCPILARYWIRGF